MIASLEDSKLKTERDYDQAHQYLLDSKKLHQELREEWNKFEQQKEQLYKKAEEKAERALQRAREEAELIVADIRRMKTDAELKEHEWIEARKMLEQAQPKLTKEENLNKNEHESHSRKTLHSGDDVKVLSLNQKGMVLKKSNNNEYLVQVGIMKVNFKRSDLQIINSPNKVIDKPMATIKGDRKSTRLNSSHVAIS